METDLEAGRQIEDFDKKVDELKTSIETRPKNLFDMPKDQLHLIPKTHVRAECHYLCQTFEECGITATHEDSQESCYQVFSLQASSSEPALKKIYPKYFDCTLEKIELKCLNNEKFNFGIVCNILGNVNSLGYLDLQFAKPPLLEFELLSNLILREKINLGILNIEFPLTEASIASFREFATTLLSQKKVYKITLSWLGGKVTWRIFWSRIPCSLSFCQVNIWDDRSIHSSILSKSFKAFSELLKSIHFEEFKFNFERCVEDPSSFQHFHYFLENLPDLLNLQLKISGPALLKNNLLNRVIFEGIIRHKQLKTLDLFIPGNPEGNNPEINELCGHLENAEYSNNNLQELNLNFYNFKNINLQKILIFISCFCQLKALKLRFYLVKKNLTAISEFFKRINELKGLEKFTFEFFTAKELSPNQLEELKALLPSSLTESAIVFEKLTSETARKCSVYLSPAEISQDEDDE